MNYSGRKILILGANAETIPIIKVAQNMGIHVTVTDNIPKSPAKAVADDHLDINGKDIDMLARIVDERGIDGIMVGVADSLVPSYYALCKKADRPCYAKERSCRLFSDKSEWKTLCSKYGIKTLRQLYSGNCFSEKLLDLSLPLVIKPQISRGGKGVSICRSSEDVQAAFEIACSISDNSQCVIEQYCEGRRLSAYYMVVDGSPVLLNLADCTWRSASESDKHFLVYSFPSTLMETYTETMEGKITEFLSDNDVQNGIVAVEMFYDKGDFYVFDLEYNVTAAISSERAYRYICRGYNAIEALIGFSISGRMILERDRDIAAGYKDSALIYIYVKEGTVGESRTDVEIRDTQAVYEIQQRLFPGSCVTQDQVLTTKAILARIWLTNTDVKRLNDMVETVINNVSINSDLGENMIIEKGDLG